MRRGSLHEANAASRHLQIPNAGDEIKLVETAKIKVIKEPVSLWYLKYTRYRQQAVLMLQHCAILSQLNRHQDALDTSKATALLIKDITHTASIVINLKQ